MILLKERPLIRNAAHPLKLFDEREMEIIRTALGRYYTMRQSGKLPKVSEEIKNRAANLLRIAREHGYYAKGIDENSNIQWECLAQSRVRNPDVITTLRPCDECGRNFWANHYQDQPAPKHCNKCGPKLDKKKVVPPELKEIKKTVRLSSKEREARIAELRQQAEKIKEDDIPF